ncbi:MAG: AmmeMemoRadiSam system radical SAM enzyme [Dehalococcoidales bacterium]|nr:AmmeMemoRadiSam system radical SAM enzyme [Dehalococcoidales bacterium]
MHEAALYEKLPGSRVQCHTCQRRCRINPEKHGACGMYRNDSGTLFNLNYGRVSSAAADPIEKKPLFHFHPGTLCFSLGTLGCNFQCRHCQNWEISTADGDALQQNCRELMPDASVRLARDSGCAGMAWTYNEPTIWFEHTLDSAKTAKENGLYTVYVTNGYTSPEALDTIGPYLDAWRVDIKGFSDEFYKDIAGVPQWEEILEVTSRAQHIWNMHVEVVTNIIPTMNDDNEQLEGIARWIHDELGDLTPWHVTRFQPHHQLRHLPPTPVETIDRACETGREAGLKFVYAGNVPGHESESTRCYHCGATAVRRLGYQTEVTGLNGSRCRSCGTDLNFRNPAAKEDSE